MIELAQAADSKVLLLGVRLPPNYGEAYISQFQGVYIDLAKKYDTAIVPNLLQHIDNNQELMSADGIHPRAAAQPQMLANVWAVLEPLL